MPKSTKKSNSTSSRTQKNSRSAGRSASRSTWWSYCVNVCWKLFLIGVVFAFVGMIYLDAQVKTKFEGKRWELPAKVYARPLELYQGKTLSVKALQEELSFLGYRFVASVNGAGTAELGTNRIRVQTRGFSFPDEHEPARQLLISFTGQRVASIEDEGSRTALPLVRLEPALIGGIYPRSNEDRDLIRLQDAPPFLAEALITVEDKQFYHHWGISLKGIARAMVANMRAGRFVQGGSTLTQQLIKNFYLTSDRTLARKLLELPMAIVMDLRYSKDEILEAYLNEVYLGQSGVRAIHGFGLASQFYFARPIAELELHQVALLVALAKGPSFYDPRRNPERALQRRNLVLSLLYEAQYITQQQLEISSALPLGVRESRNLPNIETFPAYLDLVKRQLRKEYRDEDLSSEGLLIFTALDPLTQARADAAVSQQVRDLERQYADQVDTLQAAMVVTDPRTGEVLAMVGGKNTRFEGFNRALDAVRPVGSLLKPAIYLTALEKGYTLGTVLEDKPVDLTLPNGDVWQPQNFDRVSHGSVLLIDALAKSLNQTAVHLGLQVGVQNVIETLHELGIKGNIPKLPSIFLGSLDMTPLDVTQMYQTFAADGFNIPLRSIRSVTTAEGKELSRYPFNLRQVVSSETMYLMRHAMQEVGRSGTARSAYRQLSRELNFAGKTGTSNDQRDSWFAGYTQNRLAVVWVGNDDNLRLPFTSVGGALSLWSRFMDTELLEPLQPRRPGHVEYVWVDELSGYLSDSVCESSRQLPYIRGTAPEFSVDCGQIVERPEVRPEEQPSQSSGLDWFRSLFQ